MRKKKGFFWQTRRTVRHTVLYYYRGYKVDPEPFSVEPVAQQDPQPGPSSLSLVLKTDPGPSGLKSELTAVPGALSVEMTRASDPADPEPSSVSGPSSLQLTPDTDPTSSDPLPVPAPSGLEPVAPQDLVDPLTGARSNLELTPDPEPEPVPGPSGLHAPSSGFGPANVSFFSLYDVGVSLGSGNFGTVYEGTRRSDGQKVAIKFLNKSVQDCFIYIPGCVRPLLVEVALNLVVREPPQSPYIIQMYEWFEQHYRYILILEYPHPCETLLNFTLSNGGYLEETVARGFMRQTVLAAKHCLARGVFHRDIKSDNILVNTETLQVKLIDFGCGKLLETSDYKEYTECPAVKATVKSLGVLLFRMVNGISFVDVQMIPSSTLSSECCDLLNQCKSSSLTLDELLEHEWFRKS